MRRLLLMVCLCWMGVAEAEVVTVEHVHPCTNSVQCSLEAVAALEAEFGVVLHMTNPTDTVHGSVTILHAQPPDPHVYRIEFYEADDPPQLRGRRSHLKPPPAPIAAQQVAVEIRKLRGP